jgi:tetratricopeptide (TPR) repeat protein
MLAISISGGDQPIASRSRWHDRWAVRSGCGKFFRSGILLTVLSGAVTVEAIPPVTPSYQVGSNLVARAAQAYEAAETRFRSEPQNADAAWKFARACFDLAEFSTNHTQRAELAEKGITASQRAIAHAPKLVQGHYYLGMNHGQLARTKSIGALRLVDRMESEFNTARTLDEHFDFAGPDRNLGLLYLEAPTVVSIGNKSKARRHLQKALTTAPGFPENHLNLIEAYLKWNDLPNALQEYKNLKSLWTAAHDKFTGDRWEVSWLDWESRYQKVKETLEPEMK